MPQAQGPWPNRFVWHDLMTTSAAKAEAFYTALFGWELVDMQSHDHVYRMIHAGPGPIGGIIEEQNVPFPHWMPYVAVEDVDRSAEKCKSLGGTVHVPPADIPDVGRFAVVGDPQGATFTLFAGNAESPGFDPDQPLPGRVCWNELLTSDDRAAQRFYSSMFGWREEPKDIGPMGTYRVQLAGDKQAGGIMKNPQPRAPSFWLAYFLVEDLGRSTARAKELGATAQIEGMPIPEVGAFSLLTDPVGAMFALFVPGAKAG